MIPYPKPLEIFCGTGGVGKTTLSTSRAVNLALQGKKVLLITIDPAKRLKDVLSLNEADAGTVQKIPGSLFNSEESGISRENQNQGQNQNQEVHLDALLISPLKTLERVIAEHDGKLSSKNRILQILFRPNGGMNEIMSLLEVQYHLRSGRYDSIVLDTPPGRHFIEFLEGCHRVQNFFDQSFIDIFHFINKSGGVLKGKPGTNLFKKFLSTGIKKLLDYLESFTGGNFVQEFLIAVETIYKLKAPFLESLQFQHHIKDPKFSNWYLVTSTEHDKIQGAMDLKKSAQEFLHQDSYMAINKCLEGHFKDWEEKQEKLDKKKNSEDNKPLQEYLSRLKHSMLDRERKLKESAKRNFPHVLEFREVLSSSVLAQVMELAQQWEPSSKKN